MMDIINRLKVGKNSWNQFIWFLILIYIFDTNVYIYVFGDRIQNSKLRFVTTSPLLQNFHVPVLNNVWPGMLLKVSKEDIRGQS